MNTIGLIWEKQAGTIYAAYKEVSTMKEFGDKIIPLILSYCPETFYNGEMLETLYGLREKCNTQRKLLCSNQPILTM